VFLLELYHRLDFLDINLVHGVDYTTPCCVVGSPAYASFCQNTPYLNLGNPAEAIQALQFASRNGHFFAVDNILEILEKHKVLDSAAEKDNFALISAIHCNSLPVINRLLRIPAVLSVAIRDPYPVMYTVIRSANLSIINRFLVIPVFLATVAKHDNAWLRWAVSYGNLDVVNFLLEIPSVLAAVDAKNNDALKIAAESNHPTIVNRLLEIPAVRARCISTLRRVEGINSKEHIFLGLQKVLLFDLQKASIFPHTLEFQETAKNYVNKNNYFSGISEEELGNIINTIKAQNSLPLTLIEMHYLYSHLQANYINYVASVSDPAPMTFSHATQLNPTPLLDKPPTKSKRCQTPDI